MTVVVSKKNSTFAASNLKTNKMMKAKVLFFFVLLFTMVASCDTFEDDDNLIVSGSTIAGRWDVAAKKVEGEWIDVSQSGLRYYEFTEDGYYSLSGMFPEGYYISNGVVNMKEYGSSQVVSKIHFLSLGPNNAIIRHTDALDYQSSEYKLIRNHNEMLFRKHPYDYLDGTWRISDVKDGTIIFGAGKAQMTNGFGVRNGTYGRPRNNNQRVSSLHSILIIFEPVAGETSGLSLVIDRINFFSDTSPQYFIMSDSHGVNYNCIKK